MSGYTVSSPDEFKYVSSMNLLKSSKSSVPMFAWWNTSALVGGFCDNSWSATLCVSDTDLSESIDSVIEKSSSSESDSRLTSMSWYSVLMSESKSSAIEVCSIPVWKSDSASASAFFLANSAFVLENHVGICSCFPSFRVLVAGPGMQHVLAN